MVERSWYLSDFADEIMPCDATLEGWARWLSKPDKEWGRDQAASDGAQFKASATLWAADIVATRSAGEWSFSRDVGDAGFVAVRFAQGLGWSPDNIIWGEDMGDALREWFAENDEFCDDVEYIAVGEHEPERMLTYRADPPRLDVGSAVQ